MRDSQRQKLYNAEHSTPTWKAGHAEPFTDLKDVERYVKRVIRSKFWDQQVNGRCHVPRIGDGRGRRSAYGNSGEVVFPRWARFPMVILHELAHTAICRTHHHSRVAAHGHEFAAMFLKLVSRFMGTQVHDELKASFKAHGVRFRPKRKRVMTEEQRQVLRARLANARTLAAARRAA